MAHLALAVLRQTGDEVIRATATAVVEIQFLDPGVRAYVFTCDEVHPDRRELQSQVRDQGA